GLLEVHAFTEDERILRGALRMAEGMRSAMQPGGRLPGRLDSAWRAAVTYSCLTGTVQIAYCWLMLYALTSDPQWLAAARAANRFVRTTVRTERASADVRGAVKGSFPVAGAYCRWQFPAWATKFTIDAHRLERRVSGGVDWVPASR
ncbi:MAG: hypothetical protein L0271_08090, partial [Gemmatimonadetes bacterium]|nr:hypothetical protein [Gemmatimonadota bacterium]